MFRQTLRAGAAFMRARGSTASRTASRSMATTATRSSSRRVALGASVAGVAAGATWLSLDEAHCSILDYFFGGSSAPAMPKEWEPVAEDIVAIIEDNMRMGPTFVRLAWHLSGSYDKASNSGGSNGGLMRFKPESDYGANAGLNVARDALEPVKAKYPDITYADLYTFAGKVAVENSGGPVIPWTPGRTDGIDGSECAPDGRLPDAAQGSGHVRDIFYRMGFNDQEIVALLGAHTLGRCYTDRSGYEGPWSFDEFGFDNSYFQLLVEEKWETNMERQPLQFTDSKTKSLMMLPADIAMVADPGFRTHVEKYAKSQDAFFKDFASAFGKLLENGVPRN